MKRIKRPKTILQYRRAFDIYLAKYFPKVIGIKREKSWVRFCIAKHLYK